MPDIPTLGQMPDAPVLGQLPDLPTLGAMPTMPDMYTLPDMPGMYTNPAMPDMYTLPDMPERGAIPEIPDAMRALYEDSPDTQAAYQKYLASVGQKPSDYSSQYLPQMDAIMQKYGSQAPFNYDINGDMLYQQMKDQYIRNGQRAMMDAQGQASAMTGGYGSTYAQGVGQQQYNQHLEALNNNIPALYDRQYQQYRDQRGDMLNQFNMAGNLENTNYGRYRDTVGDWKDETGRTYGEFKDSRTFGYNKYLNEIQQAGTVYNKELDNFWNQYNDDMNRYGIKKEDVVNTYAEMMARYGEEKVDIQNVYNELMNRYGKNVTNIQNMYGENMDRYDTQKQDVYDLYGVDMDAYGNKRNDVLDTYSAANTTYSNQRQGILDTYGAGLDAYDLGASQVKDKYDAEVDAYDTNLSNIWDVYGANVDQVNAYNQNTDAGYRNALGQAETLNSDTWNRYNSGMSQYNQSLQNIWNEVDYQNSLVDQERGDLSAAQGEARTLAEVYFAQGQMPPEDILQAAGIDAETAKLLMAQMTPMTGGSTGGSSGGSRGTGSSNLKSMTQVGWDALQAAFDTGGREALLAEADKQRMQGYDPGPALDWYDKYKISAWEAGQVQKQQLNQAQANYDKIKAAQMEAEKYAVQKPPVSATLPGSLKLTVPPPIIDPYKKKLGR